ncbi:hypothetical protein [Mesorhizobium sp.]|uniref:hypothetical protein n=1 Tax=Mesorhizobium sp. TaxID=1871066 RepID=UPI001216B5AD|nr:hypothetical protein [Mesorhizobium sp.]TIL50469.1 MAG: hypothetical protein E5Y83_21860 [Mesorhizobium sp.]TIL97042.1 MAG: hypothetical protein E5Y68_00225 [Mesorhizobium sp.]
MFEIIDLKAILIVFMIFVPLEHLVPLHEGRRYLRRAFVTDLLHLLVTGLLPADADTANLSVDSSRNPCTARPLPTANAYAGGITR